ncbi:hypothetical protein [Glaciimonas immobilis]|uniref:Uncharacterized protein n=1 Tax=Glaciimonas immobilis TaxID=728004 RepID=A0A840RP85_9BURK|nr:hypothetical protein [Glaciimonas immobilis]KAF3998925.1 hypothetical protein HAV38_02895 [Glaciimonas immobilis]MBB5198329.1 hypothetical protein [Glaciimonas immobilis]
MGVKRVKDETTTNVANGNQGQSTAYAVGLEGSINAHAFIPVARAVPGAGAEAKQISPASDVAIAADREWQRRKWIWQMGTIVFMGLSGLVLNVLVKSMAITSTPASVNSVDAYCEVDGHANMNPSANSSDRTATSIAHLCPGDAALVLPNRIASDK